MFGSLKPVGRQDEAVDVADEANAVAAGVGAHGLRRLARRKSATDCLFVCTCTGPKSPNLQSTKARGLGQQVTKSN